MSANDSHPGIDPSDGSKVIMHQGTVEECAICDGGELPSYDPDPSIPVESPPDTSIIDAIAPDEDGLDTPEEIQAMEKAFKKGTLPEKDRRPVRRPKGKK